MSVSINNLFNYSRSLPVPFDTMTNKKVKVASIQNHFKAQIRIIKVDSGFIVTSTARLFFVK